MYSEAARLRKLYQMELLDTPAERDFDEIVQLASQLASTPISLITLLDADRQWFKAKVGLDALHTDRPSAVCNHTIQGDSLFEVEDLLTDRRFENNSLVKSGPKLRYYAGMPLITSDGYRLGALCVIDTKSRTKLNEDQAFALSVLARQAMNQIELRVKNRELNAVKKITDRLVGTAGIDFENITNRVKAVLTQAQPQNIEQLSDELELLQDTLNLADRSFANMISWSRLQLKNKEAQTASTLLLAVAEDCVATMTDAAQAKGNTIKVEIKSDAQIPVPEAALHFIIRNMLDNANKFTSNGQISLRYFTSGGSLEVSPRQYICVEDAGIGLPEEAIAAFKRGEELPTRPGTNGETGHGNGLMLIRHLLQHLGGNVHINSVPGGHCSVIVIL